MAWILDGTTIEPYNMIAPHNNNPTTFTPRALLNGGHRVGKVTKRKSWSFTIKWVSTAVAATIIASLNGGSFILHDEYQNADYTVHCLAFSEFDYYDLSKLKTGCSISLEIL